jgi:hypothetical protein
VLPFWYETDQTRGETFDQTRTIYEARFVRSGGIRLIRVSYRLYGAMTHGVSTRVQAFRRIYLRNFVAVPSCGNWCAFTMPLSVRLGEMHCLEAI